MKEHPIGEVWFDNTPYILDGDDREEWVRGSLIPDVSFVSKEQLEQHHSLYGTTAKYFHLAPALAVEIVSQHDRYSDIVQKVADYLQHGTQLVWIIDTQSRTIRVHSQDDPDGKILYDADTLSGESVLPDRQMAVSSILDID